MWAPHCFSSSSLVNPTMAGPSRIRVHPFSHGSAFHKLSIKHCSNATLFIIPLACIFSQRFPDLHHPLQRPCLFHLWWGHLFFCLSYVKTNSLIFFFLIWKRLKTYHLAMPVILKHILFKVGVSTQEINPSTLRWSVPISNCCTVQLEVFRWVYLATTDWVRNNNSKTFDTTILVAVRKHFDACSYMQTRMRRSCSSQSPSHVQEAAVSSTHHPLHTA